MDLVHFEDLQSANGYGVWLKKGMPMPMVVSPRLSVAMDQNMQDVDRSNKPRQAGGVLYRQQMKAYSHDELLVKHADLPPKQVVGIDRFGSGAMMEPTITRNLQTSKHKETIALDIHHETLVMG